MEGILYGIYTLSVIRYSIAALLVFSAGFLLFHGREAAHSGSWNYIVTHDDEYIYWALAQGSTASPASDANPFYYEERTERNPIPSYLTVSAAGKLAAALNIQVLALLPLWKILMPFSLWLVLFCSLARLWGYGPAVSAAVSMLILLSTLFLHGSAQFTLFRFPRPGDGLGLMLLWLSLLVHADRMSARRYQVAMLSIGVATMAITPYYTILQVWTVALQGAWDWWVCRDRDNARSHWLVLSVLSALACGYLAYILLRMAESFWVTTVLEVGRVDERHLHLPSLLLCVLVGLVVYAMWRRSGVLTRLDRLVLFVLAIEPLTAHVQLVLGNDHQIGLHRYYFFVPEIACLLGWSVEKMRNLVHDEAFRRVEWWIVVPLALLALFILARPELNYFLYLPRDVSTYDIFDNSLLLLYLIPPLLLGPWFVLRFAAIGRLVARPVATATALVLMACAGFYLRSSQLHEFNRAIPFTGAYEWLAGQQVEDIVLLTGPEQRATVDYGLFYVDAKSYYNTNGQRFSLDEVNKEHRRFVYAATMHGGLSVVLPEFPTLAQKLKHLKLDYILLERCSWCFATVGPHEDHITAQLSQYIQEVYRDERCILWQLVVP